jgi:hypothetical protein
MYNPTNPGFRILENKPPVCSIKEFSFCVLFALIVRTDENVIILPKNISTIETINATVLGLKMNAKSNGDSKNMKKGKK